MSSAFERLVATLDYPLYIVTVAAEDKARIALHLYNVEHDVDGLLEALTRHRALLA